MFNKFGLLNNPAVQLDTSCISTMQLNGIDVAQDTEPQFMEADDEPLNYFVSSDPLYYHTFDPSDDTDILNDGDKSLNNAENLNPLT